MDTHRIKTVWEEDGIRIMEMSMDMGLNIFLGEWERRMGRDAGYKKME